MIGNECLDRKVYILRIPKMQKFKLKPQCSLSNEMNKTG